ncbi:MAG: hypothetical protein JJO71_21385 [Escherichia coli]|nr:hypothetical protein [Escherichia coli]
MKEMMKGIMKKKEYFAPSIQVIEMEHSCSILAASGEKPEDDFDDWGPGYGTNDPRHPGEGL